MTQYSYPAAAPESAARPAVQHNLILENRQTVTATGITRIVSYDEFSASLETGQGSLVIGGRDIRVSELSIQTGELKIYGKIEYVLYSDTRETAGGFFKRLAR